MAAWLTVVIIGESLAPDDGHGAGVAVGSVMVVLLTIASIVAWPRASQTPCACTGSTPAHASGPASAPRTTQPARTRTVTRHDTG
jgi:hypothetical protein